MGDALAPPSAPAKVSRLGAAASRTCSTPVGNGGRAASAWATPAAALAMPGTTDTATATMLTSAGPARDRMIAHSEEGLSEGQPLWVV